MNVTWRQQIVVYCVLLVARIFADDPQLVQDLKNLSNKITTQDTKAAQPSLEEFATKS
jgi:hypothetical protein